MRKASLKSPAHIFLSMVTSESFLDASRAQHQNRGELEAILNETNLNASNKTSILNKFNSNKNAIEKVAFSKYL